MATLDNIDKNMVYYVERKEIYPENSTLLHEMEKYNIIKMINNKTICHTFEYINNKYNIVIDNPGFKTKIKESFVLKNMDAINYCAKVGYTSYYTSAYEKINEQTLYPKDAIDYYVINYVKKIVIETVESYYNYFIIVARIDTSKEPSDFKSRLYTDESMLGKFIKSYMKWDWYEMNNINNTSSSENMTISTMISDINKNYMNQQMIEQPDFLNYNLYYYQRADLYFMMMREKSSETYKFILDDARMINWGTKWQCLMYKDGHDYLEFMPRRTIHNYTGELNNFVGGCLCNSPGLGKTLEILTLCCLEPSLNLIIVPEHLYDHWIDEYKKHIKDGYMNLLIYTDDSIDFDKYLDKPTIVLIVYNHLTTSKKLFKMNFTRLIIDEFHELFDKTDKTFPLINEIKTQYKWAITGTPFINSSMIMNIMNFVVKNKVTNPDVAKYKSYINRFCEMFRKNTKESVEIELSLPRINEKIYVLNLSEFERLAYNSLLSGGTDEATTINRQMAFCINPNIYFNDANGVSEKYMYVDILEAQIINMHQRDYEHIFSKLVDAKKEVLHIVKYYKLTKSNILTIYDFVVNDKINFYEVKDILEKEFEDIVVNEANCANKFCNFLIDQCGCKSTVNNSELFIKQNQEQINKINELEKKLEGIRKQMIFFEEQTKLINCKTKKLKRQKKTLEYTYEDEETKGDYVPILNETTEDDINCTVCLSPIDDDFTLLQCGHSFCSSCLKLMLESKKDQCPTCSMSIKNTTIYKPSFEIVVNKEMVEMIKKYGTKISHLINICKNRFKEKMIIYCDSPSLIDNLVNFLNENDISSITPKNDTKVTETIKEFKINKQVLVLSSEFNASGLNLQFVNTILILQPIRGEYARIKQIENQIIGRVHRIGQAKEINLIRLIVKDSIETELLRQNIIFDEEYSSSNKKSDYPLTVKQIEELTE